MTTQLTAEFAGIVATLLMILAGSRYKRVGLRSERCPVCHRTRSRCTCRSKRWAV
jgi:hypothetical protein